LGKDLKWHGSEGSFLHAGRESLSRLSKDHAEGPGPFSEPPAWLEEVWLHRLPYLSAPFFCERSLGKKAQGFNLFHGP